MAVTRRWLRPGPGTIAGSGRRAPGTTCCVCGFSRSCHYAKISEKPSEKAVSGRGRGNCPCCREPHEMGAGTLGGQVRWAARARPRPRYFPGGIEHAAVRVVSGVLPGLWEVRLEEAWTAEVDTFYPGF